MGSPILTTNVTPSTITITHSNSPPKSLHALPVLTNVGLDFGMADASIIAINYSGSTNVLELEGQSNSIPSTLFFGFDDDFSVFGKAAFERYYFANRAVFCVRLKMPLIDLRSYLHAVKSINYLIVVTPFSPPSNNTSAPRCAKRPFVTTPAIWFSLVSSSTGLLICMS